MPCASLPVAIPTLAWPGPLAEDDPSTRLSDLLRMLADIAEPTAEAMADATDLPAGLLDALAAWKTQHRNAF
jgi:hypothetical protein